MSHRLIGSDDSLGPNSIKLSLKRHFVPPFLGIFMMLLVLGLFNTQFIAAKLHAFNYKPPVASATIPERANVDANQPPKLIINDITVDAPIIFDQPTVDEAAFQDALQRGVVHYPGTALPGQSGNVVVFGHSSGPVWGPGDYKFVFTHLEKLQSGQKIFLEYKGERYIYEVTGSKVVPPTDVSVLDATDDSTLTLITCTPVGTNKNRLIVTAKQIVPNPNQVNTQPEGPQPISAQELPGNATPSFIESLLALF